MLISHECKSVQWKHEFEICLEIIDLKWTHQWTEDQEMDTHTRASSTALRVFLFSERERKIDCMNLLVYLKNTKKTLSVVSRYSIFVLLLSIYLWLFCLFNCVFWFGSFLYGHWVNFTPIQTTCQIKRIYACYCPLWSTVIIAPNGWTLVR